MTLTLGVPEAGNAATDSPTVEARFWAQIDSLRRHYIDLWRSCAGKVPVLGAQRSRWEQWAHARASKRLIDDLGKRIETYPEQADAQEDWRRATRLRVQRYGEAHLGWPDGYRRLLFGDEYFDATVEFARLARRLDPDLPLDDLFQALRNAWIANCIQMLLDLEVRCSPAIFAYSMLYPYTDNILDDPRVRAAVKRGLNRRLERRLRGQELEAQEAGEQRLYWLIEQIEGEYPRDDYPEVHLSLQAIHRAQTRSLDAQAGGPALSEAELLAISIEKGGASVLADGYLAAGRLTPAEAEFCFGYGVLLQLLDDLQDMDADRRAGQQTLFSHLPHARTVDSLVSRLVELIDQVLAPSPRFASAVYAERLDLIRRNCVTLLVGAVAENPSLCSPAFARHLEERWPLRFASMRRLRKRAKKVYDKRLRSLQRARRAASLLELIGD